MDILLPCRFARYAGALGLLGLVAALTAPIPAHAVVTLLEVIPAQPTIADSVTLHVEGYLDDGCWRAEPIACGTVAGDSISIVEHGTDTWQPGTGCPLILVHYGGTCRYGPLPAGSYRVTFTEIHTSLRDPQPRRQSLTFTVSDATPVTTRSWGRLKLLYR